MSSVYLFAHCDDEYAAWPLLHADKLEGRAVRLYYLTRPTDPKLAARRTAESRSFLRDLGMPGAELIDLSEASGARDGRLLGALAASYLLLKDELAQRPPPATITTPAWEGGHLDHDLCAVLAVALAPGLAPSPRLRQVSLYHGAGLSGLLFRSGPLPQGGATRRLRLSLADWIAFARAARAYPSQAHVFSTWWPAMFGAYLRGGYRYQDLWPSRVLERPHAGPLLYERRRLADYASVARRVKSFLNQTRERAPPIGRIERR